MTHAKYPITDEEYEPDTKLAKHLVSFEQRVDIRSEGDGRFSGVAGVKQRSYVVDADESELEGFETKTPFNLCLSLQGNLGLASAFILACSITFGKPTLVYCDEGPIAPNSGDQYQDVTAEWYTEAAVERGLDEKRFEFRTAPLDAQQIDVSTLEEYAEPWLLLG